MISNETLPVNEQSQSVTIQRGKHNKENPYVQISRKMLRDTTISPKAKGVLCFLLSLPDNWQAHPRHLAMSLGVGKDQIYSILKELIQAGYATRTESKGEKGKFGNVLYEFYEEKLDVPQQIKEKSTVSGNPDTDNPDTGNQTLRNKDSTEKRPNSSLKVPKEPVAAEAAEMESSSSSSSPKKKREKPDFSSKVRDMGNQLINLLSRVKPDYVHPKNLTAFLTEVDFLLRLDKRDPQKVLDVFSWALSDSFWADKMFKPNPAKYLREKFDQLEMKMLAKPDQLKKTPESSFSEADSIPFNPDIAQTYRDESEEAYVSYLKRITDKKYYNDYMKSKGQ
jgi:hypothetical protein